MMLVFRPDFGAADEKKIVDLIKKTVGESTSIKEVKLIGKKTLAYPIKKFTEGIYALVTLESDKIDIAQIQKQVDLGTDILRFLVILKEGWYGVSKS